MSNSDQGAVTLALTQRGLLGGPLLDSSWATVGPGAAPNPGLFVEDDYLLLKFWLTEEGGDPTLITQGPETGLNHRLDPGDVAAVWFDIQNSSAITAGGLEVTVKSLDSDVTILDGRANWAPIATAVGLMEAQTHYFKVNGTSIVQDISSANQSFHVATGNSYFKTNPFYKQDPSAAVWIKVSPTAPHGKQVTLQVTSLPTNGAASVTHFTAVIQ